MRKFYLLIVLIVLFAGIKLFAQSARIDKRQMQDTLITPLEKAAVSEQGPFRRLGGKTPMHKKPHRLGRDPFAQVEDGGGGGVTTGGCSARVGDPSPGNASVCPGNNSTTMTVANYNGNLQWQSSIGDEQHFADIPGATEASYTATNLNVSTYFRVDASSFTEPICHVFTNSSLITVLGTPIPGTINGGDITVCPNANSTQLSVVNYPSGGATFQWESSTDNQTFFPIAGAAGSVYTASNLVTTTYYHALVSNGCFSATTPSVQIAMGAAQTWYKDQDNDGYSDGITLTQCERPTNYKLASELIATSGDCDDSDPTVWQSGTLYIDNDGDGYTSGQQTLCYGNVPPGYVLNSNGSDCDDSDPRVHSLSTFYRDADHDGYGDPNDYITLCALFPPKGYVGNANDCDDDNAEITPITIWYKDADNDGYSDGSSVTQCVRPTNYKLASELIATAGDCDDNNASVNPALIWYKDVDNDGYSDGTTQTQCTRPINYKLASELTATSGDCNDYDASINPTLVWYKDVDNDGYSDGATLIQCARPPGYKLAAELTATSGDCNDNDASINLTMVWYKDADNDGYSDGTTITQCTRPANYKLSSELIATSGDCNDSDPAINPGTILTITAPAAKNVNTDAGKCSASNVSLGNAVASNNCAVLTVTNNAPSVFQKGPTLVIWSVSDPAGHRATASQTVTVLDNEKPKITCPSASVQCYNSGGTYTIPTLTANDNCAIQSTTFAISGATSRNGSGNNASGAFNPGTSTITWTVTDGSGNISTCSATVKVDKVEVTIADAYASGITSSIGSPNTIYIGYGGTSITLMAQTKSSLSPNTYTYKWTTGSPAGPGFATTQSITISPSTTTTYFVSIRDANNCSQIVQVSKQINVVDIRCGTGKINVCQPKNGSYSTACVSSNTKTISGLPAGSYLGSCVKAVTAKKVIPEENGLAVTANPNPTNESFTVKVSPPATEGSITLRVFNISGQLVEMRNVNAIQTFKIGENYKRGIYLIEVTSGLERKTLTVIKQ